MSLLAWFKELFEWVPPLADHTALHVDLASALIALIALAFSVWTFANDKRISLARIRIARDGDLIGWINSTIEIIVAVEFLLRAAKRGLDGKSFAGRRDAELMRLAAAIDKGRLYFPAFTRDVVAGGAGLDPKLSGGGVPLLDRLVEVYDIVKDLEGGDAKVLDDASYRLLVKKREFVLQAQSEIEPERRWIERRRPKSKQRRKAIGAGVSQ